MGSVVVGFSSLAVDFCAAALNLPFCLDHCPKAAVISASPEVQLGSGVLDPVCLPA